MSNLSVSPLAVPVVAGEDGVMVIQGTRVTLDTVVTLFDQGATAEEITQRFSTLQLADVYAVIAYYLAHFEEVRAYLAARQQRRLEIREANEARSSQRDIRARLLERDQRKRE